MLDSCSKVCFGGAYEVQQSSWKLDILTITTPLLQRLHRGNRGFSTTDDPPLQKRPRVDLKSGHPTPQTQKKPSARSNGMLFFFGRDVNIRWQRLGERGGCGIETSGPVTCAKSQTCMLFCGMMSDSTECLCRTCLLCLCALDSPCQQVLVWGKHAAAVVVPLADMRWIS